MLTLVLGGQRSGKSRYAENIARLAHKAVVYVATARILDAEMQERIAPHRQRRPVDWILVEEPIFITSLLEQYNSKDYCVLIDCLGMWLCNLFESTLDHWRQHFAELRAQFLNQLGQSRCDVIIVSPETGLGIVPAAKSSRLYLDEMGQLNQDLAGIADNVQFILAGLPLKLKGEGI